MKFTRLQKQTLLEQLQLWKLGDKIEELINNFNNSIELTDEEEKEYERLRKEIDKLLEVV